MKSNLLAAGLFLTVAMVGAPSFADDQYLGSQIPSSTGTLTREQVFEQLLEAKKNGSLPPNGDRGYRFNIPHTSSTLTRDQVFAEYVAAKNSGTFQVERR